MTIPTPDPCPECGGKGFTTYPTGDGDETYEAECEACLGTGKKCSGKCFQEDVDPVGGGGDFIADPNCPVHGELKMPRPKSEELDTEVEDGGRKKPEPFDTTPDRTTNERNQ